MKKCIIALFCLTLMSGCANTSMYALSDSYNTDTEIIESTAEIIETEIPENAAETANSADTAENITIDKEYTANHMLNAIDYYDKAEGSFITNMCADTEIKVDFFADGDFTYDFAEGGGMSSVTLCDGKTLSTYDNNEKIKFVSYIAEIPNQNWSEIPFSGRISTGTDGQKDYSYRMNNMPYASKCLFSQELAFGLLGDYSLWDIDGETEFLGYPVIIVKGTTESEYGGKLGMQSFMLYIEKSSGILMKLEGYDAGGNITNYIEMRDILIDKELSKDKETILKELEEKCKDYEDFNLKNF